MPPWYQIETVSLAAKGGDQNIVNTPITLELVKKIKKELEENG